MLPPLTSWLVDTSLRASMIILLLLCLRALLRRWIGSPALAFLWLIIAARLLCPVPVAVPWRMPSLLATPALVAAPVAFRVSVSADSPAKPGIAVLPRRALPASSRAEFNFPALLWLGGVLLALVRLARGWWMVRRWKAHAIPADADARLGIIYAALPAELRRGVALRLTDAFDAPALVGVLHPQIWLPRTMLETLTADELRHVLLHELGHARRRDLLAQWVCSLACCFHWFNPLVWLLAHTARTDRELACDAWVLSRDTIETEPAMSYGHTLLKVVEGMSHGTPRSLPMMSMAAGKGHLDLRVRELCIFRPVAPWRGMAALVATTALVVVGTLGNVAAKSPAGADAATNPATASSPAASPTAPVSSSSASSPAPSPNAVSSFSMQPRQIEIESKFIEVAKSSALEMQKSVPPSSPVARVFHQVFARLIERSSPASPTIFRSPPVLPDDFDRLVRQLNQAKGVDLLSAPRVTTKSDQKATIEIIREFIYPTAFQRYKGPFDKPVATPTNFDRKNTGVTLEVTPTIEPDGELIDLSLTWTITNFDGFVDADGKPVPRNEKEMPEKMPGATFPVFDTRTVSTVATLPSGTTIVFSRDEEHLFVRKSLRFATGESKREVSPEKDDDRLLLVFVTAKLVAPSGASPAGTGGTKDVPSKTGTPGPAGADLPSSQATESPAPLPYGTSVPGKPGFATSPYAPDAGYVDLRGFTRDQSVRDPYTGKMFLVP